MGAILQAMTKFLAHAYNTQGSMVGSLYDKVAAPVVGKAFTDVDQQGKVKEAVMDKILNGGNATTIDDLMAIFGQQPTKAGGMRRSG